MVRDRERRGDAPGTPRDSPGLGQDHACCAPPATRRAPARGGAPPRAQPAFVCFGEHASAPLPSPAVLARGTPPGPRAFAGSARTRLRRASPPRRVSPRRSRRARCFRRGADARARCPVAAGDRCLGQGVRGSRPRRAVLASCAARPGGVAGRTPGGANRTRGSTWPWIGAHDQRGGSVEVGAGVDPATLTFTLQVVEQDVREAARFPGVRHALLVTTGLLTAPSRGRREGLVAADHLVEAAQHAGLGHQPGERGHHPVERLHAPVDEDREILRHGAGAGLGHSRDLVHDRGDVRQQGLSEQVFLVLEVVVQRAVCHLGFPGDVAHGQAGAAALVEQSRGRPDQVLAEVLSVAVSEHGRFPR